MVLCFGFGPGRCTTWTNSSFKALTSRFAGYEDFGSKAEGLRCSLTVGTLHSSTSQSEQAAAQNPERGPKT